MRYETDTGAGGGRRLGLIVLSTDETLECEARAVLARRAVNLLHARIPARPDVTPQDLRTMAADMTRTAALLPADPAAVAYGCTSAAAMIGPAEVARLIRQAHPGVPVTDPMSAAIAALRALGVARIGFVSPYVPEVTAPMRAHLAAQGIETVSEVSFGQREDRTVARIREDSTLAAMAEAARQAKGAAGAIFASCTNLRTFGIIAAAEAELGVPVISSNQALMWHLLGLGGIDAGGWGPGRLFAGGIPALRRDAEML